jgi:2-keto-3-deoxy-L-rhamnonate aldolase RhmA
MIPLRNLARERLQAGQLAIGLNVRQARTAEIGRVLATCGYHWAFIDMEHSALTLDTAAQLAVACQDAGVTPIVRVPGYEHYHATHMLDAGAMGVIFPHVETAEQAGRLVRQCKYPPQGHRSVAGAMAQLNFRAIPLGEATAIVNQELLIVVMVESLAGIRNAGAIAAVPGVDVILIGTNDLCMEMGIPGQLGHADIKAAYRTVIEACRQHGKYPGLGGVYDEPLAREYIQMGARFVIAGSDLSLLMQAAAHRARFLQEIPI